MMNPGTKTHVSASKPLHGKRVLITRPREQAGEFAGLLTERGATVVFIPTIEIVAPSSWGQLDDALATLSTYDALVFTSANAVQAFFRAIVERGRDSSRSTLAAKQFYAIGTKTAEALHSEGYTATVFPEVTNANQLAATLATNPPRGKRFLFPRGNLGNEDLATTLRSKGAQVDDVIVYETVAPRNADTASVRRALEGNAIDVVTFFSPSSVKNLLVMVPQELLASKIIAVVGSTTEAAVQEFGLSAHIVAAKPTASDLVEAIVGYFRE